MHAHAQIDMLHDRREQHLLVLMRDRSMTRHYVQEYVRQTRQSEGVTLRVPHPLTNKYMRAPIYAGSVAWNSLPNNIRSAETKLKFKTMVKIYQTGMPLEPVP